MHIYLSYDSQHDHASCRLACMHVTWEKTYANMCGNEVASHPVHIIQSVVVISMLQPALQQLLHKYDTELYQHQRQ